MKDLDHFVVSAVDSKGMMPFMKKKSKIIDEEIKEEKNAIDELGRFIDIIRKHSKEKIHYIGEDRKHGKHIERFLFSKGGFLEVSLEHPISIQAHFTNRKRADKFCLGLKNSVNEVYPEVGHKYSLIESINVIESDEEVYPTKANKRFRVKMHKTIILALIAVALMLIFEAMETSTEYISSEISHINITKLHTIIINALVIALLFEPVKSYMTNFVEKVIWPGK